MIRENIFKKQLLAMCLDKLSSLYQRILISMARSVRLTLLKTSTDLLAWQLELSTKLPQPPDGVPQLAKLIRDICCPSAHSSDSGALGGSEVRLPLLFQKLKESGKGCDSETWEQTRCGMLVAMVMASGFPPFSSNSTIKLCLERNHCRGTWYLEDTMQLVNF